MNVHQVLEGLFLTAWGLGCLYLANRYRLSAEWRERTARSRWGWDRRTSRKAREMGELQWVQNFSESERRIVTWVGIPFLCAWTLVALCVLLHGLFT
jgi:hypothetical protein